MQIKLPPYPNWAPYLVLSFCIFYPIFFAIINANVGIINRSTIVSFEFLIVLFSLPSLLHLKPSTLNMCLMYASLIFIALSTRYFLLLEFNIKVVRDLLFVILFFSLGTQVKKRTIEVYLIVVMLIIFLVAIFELIFPGLYGQYISPYRYFISIGKDLPTHLIESGLFQSAFRPGGRYFSFIDSHRLSSIFLEPISFGFFSYICFAFYYSIFINGKKKFIIKLGLIISLVLIILSDSRQASLMVLIFILFNYLNKGKSFSFLLIPTSIIITLLLFNINWLDGRIVHGYTYLGNNSSGFLFGFILDSNNYVDSSLLYLLGASGMIGLLSYWFFPFFFKVKSKEHKTYLLGLSIFVCACFFISHGLFTVKISGLLWVLLGFFVTSKHEYFTLLRPPPL